MSDAVEKLHARKDFVNGWQHWTGEQRQLESHEAKLSLRI